MNESIKAVLRFTGVVDVIEDHQHRKLVEALERALDCHVVGHVPVNDYQARLITFKSQLQCALEDVLVHHMSDLDIGRIEPPAKLFDALGAAGVSSVQDMLKMDIKVLENLLAISEYPFSQLLLVMHPDATPLHQVQLNALEVQARNAALGRR